MKYATFLYQPTRWTQNPLAFKLALFMAVLWAMAVLNVLTGGEAIPAATVEDILADPKAAVDANVAGAENLIGLHATSDVLAWGVGGLFTLLGAARFVPGIYGTIATIAHKFLAPFAHRVAKKETAQIGSTAKVLIETIEGFDNTSTIGQLKAKLTKNMSKEHTDVVDKMTEDLKKG